MSWFSRPILDTTDSYRESVLRIDSSLVLLMEIYWMKLKRLTETLKIGIQERKINTQCLKSLLIKVNKVIYLNF